MQNSESLKRAIKIWIVIFIAAIALSGITAFALETELAWLNRLFKTHETGLSQWINKVYLALQKTNRDFPFLAYGYDWLAFAHLVIAVAFIGPLKEPARNKWVIQFGMIACGMVLPLAFIAGNLRGIPFYWQLIDCSFGIIGLVPLYVCYKKIELLERIEKANFL
jgi:hypothetical protein